MQESDKTEFALLMGELGVATGADVNRETLQVYFNRLRDCSMYQVKRAIDELIETSERFPMLSKVRSLACSFKREPTVVQDVPQIEEVVIADPDAPKTPEEFFDAMRKLTKDIADIDEALGK